MPFKKPLKAGEYKKKKAEKPVGRDQYPQPQKGQEKMGPEYGKLSSSYDDNLAKMKGILGESDDIVFREFEINGKRPYRAFLIYIDGLIDRRAAHQDIIFTLQYALAGMVREAGVTATNIGKLIVKEVLAVGEVSTVKEINELIVSIFSGDTVIIVEGFDEGITCNTRGWEHRPVGPPTKEVTLRGPEIAFNEILRMNTALIRRHIRDENLRIKTRKIGVRSKTDVSVLYIAGIAHPKVVKTVEERLAAVKIDQILDSGILAQLISDAPFSIFPTVQETERPDKAASALYDGRVVILVDGSPQALVVPNTFVLFFHSPEDYYVNWLHGNFVRLTRFFGLIITVFLPGFYVALTTYNLEMIPFTLVMTIAGNKEAVPLPAYIEILVLILLFELLREAGVRLPRALSGTIGIVGGIILGDAAIQAGLVSTDSLIVVAASAVSSMVAPITSGSMLIWMLQIPVLFASVFWGLFGFIFISIIILTYLCSLSSFGVPYFAPVAPFFWEDFKDALFLLPRWLLIERPKSMQPLDTIAQSHIKAPWWRALASLRAVEKENNPKKKKGGEQDEQ